MKNKHLESYWATLKKLISPETQQQLQTKEFICHSRPKCSTGFVCYVCNDVSLCHLVKMPTSLAYLCEPEWLNIAREPSCLLCPNGKFQREKQPRRFHQCWDNPETHCNFIGLCLTPAQRHPV